MSTVVTSLSAVDVVRCYGTDRALDGASLDVQPGEVHALIGFNGAGKSTLMKSFMGMSRPDSGVVRVLGAAVDAAGPDVWRRVGHMIESPLAYPDLTVDENLGVAAALHLVPPRAARVRAEDLLTRLDLGAWRGRRASQLSHGNRQRLQIACATIGLPDVLVLDEPTSALDPRGVVLVRGLLEDARARGCGVLVSSHHLDEVSRIADRISVMHRGRLIGALPPGGLDLERTFFELVHAYDTSVPS